MKEGMQHNKTKKKHRVAVTLWAADKANGAHTKNTCTNVGTNTHICLPKDTRTNAHTHTHTPPHRSVFTRHIKYDIQFAAELTNKI